MTAGDRPYLVSGADDKMAKVWDYQTKACVQTLEGHSHNVSAVCFHPELPVILTGMITHSPHSLDCLLVVHRPAMVSCNSWLVVLQSLLPLECLFCLNLCLCKRKVDHAQWTQPWRQDNMQLGSCRGIAACLTSSGTEYLLPSQLASCIAEL